MPQVFCGLTRHGIFFTKSTLHSFGLRTSMIIPGRLEHFRVRFLFLQEESMAELIDTNISKRDRGLFMHGKACLNSFSKSYF